MKKIKSARYKIIISFIISLSLIILSLTCFISRETPVNRIRGEENTLTAFVNFNNIAGALHNAAQGRSAKPQNGQKENRGTLEIILLLSCSLAVLGERKFLLILVEFLETIFSRLTGCKNQFSGSPCSCYRYRRLWVLKFLNPVQKMLFNRSDEFDIGPLMICAASCSVVLRPHFSILSSGVRFFLLHNSGDTGV